MLIKKTLRFKPRLIPTLFTIPALILLLVLSFWQFQRLHWKQGLIDEIKQQSQLAVIGLPEQVELTSMLYRKVKLKGEFNHAQEIHIYGGSRQFKGGVGYYIFTPMRIENNKIIMINRGWVPEKLKDPATRPESLLKGQVEVEGAIMQSEKKPLYVHDNQMSRNLWFYVDLAQMQDWLNAPIENFYILAKDVPNMTPRGRDLEPNLRNHHLGYALTWLFSAIILLVIYVIYHRMPEN